MTIAVRAWISGAAFTLTALIAVSAASGTAAQVATDRYQGMCDASAAVALNDDNFVVANDEDNVLRVYQRGRAEPVLLASVSQFLSAKKEADLEGAARIKDRIYWISSHGNSGSTGEVQARRHQFFATTITASGATLLPVAKPYQDLATLFARDDFKALGFAEAAGKNPEEGGVNIEGLAASPNGELLIGFRSPLFKGRALVTVLSNPDQVIAGAAPKLSKPSELALEGRGIRSIERIDQGYLIVAGPAGSTGDFKLFRWAGPGADKVTPLGALPYRPEAMFLLGEQLTYLSDDGDEPVGTARCKDDVVPADQKSFRGWATAVPK